MNPQGSEELGALFGSLTEKLDPIGLALGDWRQQNEVHLTCRNSQPNLRLIVSRFCAVKFDRIGLSSCFSRFLFCDCSVYIFCTSLHTANFNNSCSACVFRFGGLMYFRNSRWISSKISPLFSKPIRRTLQDFQANIIAGIGQVVRISHH